MVSYRFCTAATEAEREQVHLLNYEIFVEEIRNISQTPKGGWLTAFMAKTPTSSAGGTMNWWAWSAPATNVPFARCKAAQSGCAYAAASPRGRAEAAGC